MILVVAPFPTNENEKDGMIQRVAAIDALMKNVERSYVEVSFRRFIASERETHGRATVYRLNFFVHFLRLLHLVRVSRLVYVHSAYNALKILPFFPWDKVIFDAHGIVPEELAGDGHALASRILTIAERTAVRRSRLLVSVTQRMREHFTAKYSRSDTNDLIYPILPHFDISNGSRDAVLNADRKPCSVIYAGGLQSWQNVDKMITASIQCPTLCYTFLTGDVATLRGKLDAVQLPQVVCESAPPQAVKDRYLAHVYGYILREPILVNAVACPTKLIEYLYWGVLPIVITPKIGDFDEHTLHSINLLDFVAGRLPSSTDEMRMRELNRASLDTLILKAGQTGRRLQSLLKGAST
jgi:hypothetical protein